MSVIIKDMEMPTGGSMIVAIRPDGMVEDVMGCYVGKAVSIPPHGRCIDADELYEKCALDTNYDIMATTTRINEYMQLLIDECTTILPEDKGDAQ